MINTARWGAQNESGVCAYSLCWKGISFSDKLKKIIWFFFFLMNVRMIYGNIVVVEMIIIRWLTLSSSQVNFLTTANRSTVVLSSWLGFPEDIFNCHVNESWKYSTLRTCFSEKPWEEDSKVRSTGTSHFGSVLWNAQYLEKDI